MGALTNLMAQQTIWQLPEGSRVLFATLIVLGAFVLILGLVPVLQTLPPRGRRAIINGHLFGRAIFRGGVFPACRQR